MVASDACIDLEPGVPFRQLLASVSRATVALALGAFAIVWIVQRLPLTAPEFAAEPGATSAPAPSARSAVAIPIPPGAFFDPRFLANGRRALAAAPPRAPLSRSATPLSLAAAIPTSQAFAPAARQASAGFDRPPVLPVLSASLPAADEALPAPKPTIMPLDAAAPMPPPRPLEAERIAPAAPTAPAAVARAPERGGRSAVASVGTPADRRNAAAPPGLVPELRGRTLVYAPVDSGVSTVPRTLAFGSSSRFDRFTAVYDLAAHTVYMPDGTRLEAHSGLGDRLDDPAHVNERARGATPPHLYELTAREQLFHGVAALRLNPVGGGDIFGRAGLLAHTYMLGPNGDSNGCVSFRNYDAFLQAFRNGQVKRLAVVARLG